METLDYELAKKIANDIFECGDEPESKTQRIEFKGGVYPDKEIAQGGLCKTALIELVQKSIQDAFGFHIK